MRLISYLVWRLFGAYQIDHDMLDGLELAIEEEAARQAQAHAHG